MLACKRMFQFYHQKQLKEFKMWIGSNTIITTSNNTQNKSVKEIRIIRQSDVDKFAMLTGDLNPIHGVVQPIEKRFIHGSFLNGIISGIIGTKLPGPGTIVISQSFSFPNKCVIDKEIEFHVELTSERKLMKVSYECKQQELIVFKGVADVIRIK